MSICDLRAIGSVKAAAYTVPGSSIRVSRVVRPACWFVVVAPLRSPRVLNYSLKRSVDPAVQPVTVSELKEHLGLASSDTDQNVRLADLLTSAIEAVERDTRRSLLTQTWQLRLDDFPSEIELWNPPIQSVTSITYVDTSGSTQTVSSSVYVVDIQSEPGIVRLAYGQSWPSIRGDDRGVLVTYVAGYGDTAADVPYELHEAVKLAAQLAYDSPVPQLVAAYSRVVAARQTGVYP